MKKIRRGHPTRPDPIQKAGQWRHFVSHIEDCNSGKLSYPFERGGVFDFEKDKIIKEEDKITKDKITIKKKEESKAEEKIEHEDNRSVVSRESNKVIFLKDIDSISDTRSMISSATKINSIISEKKQEECYKNKINTLTKALLSEHKKREEAETLILKMRVMQAQNKQKENSKTRKQ